VVLIILLSFVWVKHFATEVVLLKCYRNGSPIVIKSALFVSIHFADQISTEEVCGCPLVRNVFDPTGEYCRIGKRKCNKHYNWEKLRRAEVDLERVRVVRPQ
jgi:hypothetical protein